MNEEAKKHRVTPKLIIRIRSEGRGAGRVDLRLVKWPDGNPQIEKRQFIVDGREHTGRLRGLNYEDCESIVTVWPVLKMLFIENARRRG
jgi:hypothetical protein